jgi:hypothetical protein
VEQTWPTGDAGFEHTVRGLGYQIYRKCSCNRTSSRMSVRDQ